MTGVRVTLGVPTSGLVMAVPVVGGELLTTLQQKLPPSPLLLPLLPPLQLPLPPLPLPPLPPRQLARLLHRLAPLRGGKCTPCRQRGTAHHTLRRGLYMCMTTRRTRWQAPVIATMVVGPGEVQEGGREAAVAEAARRIGMLPACCASTRAGRRA